MLLTLEKRDSADSTHPITFKTFYCVNLINFTTNYLIKKTQLELTL